MTKKLNKSLNADLTLTEGDRSFICTISAEVPDREGDVLLASGLDAKNYEKNPTVFYNHNGENLPIGRMASLKRENLAWQAKCVLASRPPEHVGEWLPDTILHLIKEGALGAVSVGFLPHTMRKPTQKDAGTYGDDCARVITRWELLELSIVTIPANQDAIIHAVSKGLDSGLSIDAKAWGVEEEEAQEQEQVEPEVKALEEVQDVEDRAELEPAVEEVKPKVKLNLTYTVQKRKLKLSTINPQVAKKNARIKGKLYY